MATKDEIFNYVMKSPENTNPAVLRSLLNGVSGSNSTTTIPLYLWPSEEAEEPVFIRNINGVPGEEMVEYITEEDASASFDTLAEAGGEFVDINNPRTRAIFFGLIQEAPGRNGRPNKISIKFYMPAQLPENTNCLVVWYDTNKVVTPDIPSAVETTTEHP